MQYKKENKIRESLDKAAVPLDIKTHNDLVMIMKPSHEQILNQYPTDSFQRLLWQSQFEAVNKTKNEGAAPTQF